MSAPPRHAAQAQQAALAATRAAMVIRAHILQIVNDPSGPPDDERSWRALGKLRGAALSLLDSAERASRLALALAVRAGERPRAVAVDSEWRRLWQ